MNEIHEQHARERQSGRPKLEAGRNTMQIDKLPTSHFQQYLKNMEIDSSCIENVGFNQ